jgi:spore cortex biosynthesis protein YabQ
LAVSVSNQALVFISACVVGACLGALYDLFRIIRLAVPCGKAAVFFQDLIFVLACTAVTFLFVLRESSGVVRFFIILGELLGAVLYSLTLGILVMKLSALIIGAVKRFLKYLRSLIMPPARRAAAKINRSIDDKGRKTKKLLIKENKLFKIRLKLTQKMLYNLLHIQKIQDENGKSKEKVRRRQSRGKKTT